MGCPSGRKYDPVFGRCDWSHNVNCVTENSGPGVPQGSNSVFFNVNQSPTTTAVPPAPPPSTARPPTDLCRLPNSRSDCAGKVSNCGSPEQKTTDCPNNGFCCVSIYSFEPPTFLQAPNQVTPRPSPSFLRKLSFQFDGCACVCAETCDGVGEEGEETEMTQYIIKYSYGFKKHNPRQWSTDFLLQFFKAGARASGLKVILADGRTDGRTTGLRELDDRKHFKTDQTELPV